MFLEGKSLELLIAAVFALIVVGPKDLPVLLRKFGQFMAKLRGMAAEFRASFDEMARQSELDELRKEVEALRHGQLADIAAHSGQAEANQIVDEINQNLADVGVQLHPPMSYQYAETPPDMAPAESPKRTPRAQAAAAKATKPKPKTQTATKPTAKPTAAKASAPRKPAARKPAVRKAKT